MSAVAPARFALAYQPPYDWDWVLAFLSRRLIAGVEQIEHGVYHRVVRAPDAGGSALGWLSVRRVDGVPALAVELSPSLAPVAVAVLSRVERLFDLGCRPDPINSVLGALAHDAPGIRVPGAFDGFELAVRAVLGQQVTVKAAHTLAGRLATRFGEPLAELGAELGAEPLAELGAEFLGEPDADVPERAAGPPAGLTRAFPDAQRLAGLGVDDLAECGLIRARAGAILAIARAIAQEGLVLAPGAPLDATLAQLLSLRGIGDWTAQYVAMRALAWPDAFPAADLILMRSLGVSTPAQAVAAARDWRPWRSYAVMHLWRRAGLARDAPAPAQA